ncbi:MAG: hypothetical protein IPJ67_05120 [Candidatus Moraniibacteriota bacterium]|nr:MAG: hypothetical protein IPJ67_05120 [Candidatus Moranbacteria bacterium]
MATAEPRDQELEYIPLDDKEHYFYSHDLGGSAALVHLGFELVSLNRENPRKVQFIFRRDPLIEDALKEYWADKLSLGARGFFDTIKMLKNRIYSE